MIPPLLGSVLREGRVAEPVSERIWSVLPREDRNAPYDALARGYDAVVGNAFYNRLVWGCSTGVYAEVARAALAASPPGAVLDCGCGSLVFTHRSYARNDLDRVLLFDRSLAMLARGDTRVRGGVFIQGNALDPPFADASFASVMAWGLLHIFGSASPLLPSLRRVMQPGAPIALSTLVLSGRGIGDRMLNLLHARGEAGRPETAATVSAAFGATFAIERSQQFGNMLILIGRAELDAQAEEKRAASG